MSDSKLWKEVKEWLQSSSSIDASTYNSYIKKTELVKISSTKYALVVATVLAKNVLATYQEIIQNKTSQLLDEQIDLFIYSKPEYEAVKKREVNKEKVAKQRKSSSFTFDTFVEGISNKDALVAAKSVLNNDFVRFNPIFIYGDSGLGKTHLLKAVKHELLKIDGDLNIQYYESTDFRKKVIDSLQNKTGEDVERVKDEFREGDYLLIDDIQMISKSDKTTEIFFDIFNSYVENEKQIIITSDKFPNDLNGFDKRLITRFSQGLSVKISKPDFDTSYNIIDFRSHQHSLNLDDDAKKYIATNYGENVRTLDGIINKISFWSIQNFSEEEAKKLITLDDIKDLLQDYTINAKGTLSAKAIKKAVSEAYNVNEIEIDGKKRTKEIVIARHVAMYLCHSLLNMNYSEIGTSFGGRDHTTAMNALQKIDELMKNPKEASFKKFVNGISKKLSIKK